MFERIKQFFNTPSRTELREAAQYYDRMEARLLAASARELRSMSQLMGHIPKANGSKPLREQLDFIDNYVDPYEALLGPDGIAWEPVGIGGTMVGGYINPLPFTSEQDLTRIRNVCRYLAQHNEWAINGHENRISYIVGTGHSYQAVSKKDAGADVEAGEVQVVIDEFLRVNKWFKRQQEIVHRKDRDGEVFLRFFPAEEGGVFVRFVEPVQVATPSAFQAKPEYSFGIQTDPEDVENIIGYFVDGEFVDASEIQHRKGCVDSNCKRGVPLYWSCRKDLVRAEKVLRNSATNVEVQSAISWIRKHKGAVKSDVQSMIAAVRSAKVTNPVSGRMHNLQHVPPGSVVDSSDTTEHEFPGMEFNAAQAVIMLQAILRAIASRLVMPEFMLTSDASNANYASTLVAEGPAVKNFERIQKDEKESDLEIIYRVIDVAILSQRLQPDVLTRVEIKVTMPRLTVRDSLKETQRNQVLNMAKILSRRTWSEAEDVDFDNEQTNFDQDTDAEGLPHATDGDLPVGDDELPKSTDQTDAAEKAEVQATALNGAQIAALVSIATAVADGTFDADTGKSITAACFPLMSEEDINSIFDNIEVKEPEPQPMIGGPNVGTGFKQPGNVPAGTDTTKGRGGVGDPDKQGGDDGGRGGQPSG